MESIASSLALSLSVIISPLVVVSAVAHVDVLFMSCWIFLFCLNQFSHSFVTFVTEKDPTPTHTALPTNQRRTTHHTHDE